MKTTRVQVELLSPCYKTVRMLSTKRLLLSQTVGYADAQPHQRESTRRDNSARERTSRTPTFGLRRSTRSRQAGQRRCTGQANDTPAAPGTTNVKGMTTRPSRHSTLQPARLPGSQKHGGKPNSAQAVADETPPAAQRVEGS